MESKKIFPAGLGLPPKVPTPRTPLGAGSHLSLPHTTSSPIRASSSSIIGHKRSADGVIIKNPTIGVNASSSSSTNLGLLGTHPGRYLSLRLGGAPSPSPSPSPLIPTPIAVDPKDEEQIKLKRIMSNRVSAQKSRTKKFQYVADLEKMARTLEAEVGRLSPKVQLCKNRMSALLIEQKRLSNQLAACARKKSLTEAETGRRRAEVHQLRLVQLQQQQNALAQCRRRAAAAAAAAARASPSLNLELSLGRPSRSSAPHY